MLESPNQLGRAVSDEVRGPPRTLTNLDPGDDLPKEIIKLLFGTDRQFKDLRVAYRYREPRAALRQTSESQAGQRLDRGRRSSGATLLNAETAESQHELLQRVSEGSQLGKPNLAIRQLRAR